MQIINKKTGQHYDVSDDAAKKLKNSELGKRFKFKEPPPAPPELKERNKPKPMPKPEPTAETPAATE